MDDDDDNDDENDDCDGGFDHLKIEKNPSVNSIDLTLLTSGSHLRLFDLLKFPQNLVLSLNLEMVYRFDFVFDFYASFPSTQARSSRAIFFQKSDFAHGLVSDFLEV